MNLDTLKSRQPVGSRTMADLVLEGVRRFAPDLVVIDESHLIKSPSSNVSALARRIGALARRRLILTGTVASHSPLDVYGQWRFLAPEAFSVPDPRHPGQRKAMTKADFEDRFAVFGGHFGRQVTGYKNLDLMNRTMADNAIVVRKSEALDLPSATEVVVPVMLSPAERSLYADLRKRIGDQIAATDAVGGPVGPTTTTPSGDPVTVTNTLTQALRLRQVTAGYVPDDEGELRQIGTSKVDTIASLVNDTLVGEDRVVVFAVFRHEIDQLAAALARRGTTVEVVNGDTPNAERIAIRRRFGDTTGRPGRIVLVAQIVTMSLSVNELVAASHAVFASLSTQRDQFEQAKDRLNRIGQTAPVTFWLPLAPHTVDEVIYEAHKQRRSLEAAILAHVAPGQDVSGTHP